MMITSLSDLKASLGRNINISFFIIFTISIVLVYAAHGRYKQKMELLNQEKLQASITMYISDLSEKLSIIASSSIFLDYLRSGDYSREQLYPTLLEQINLLKNTAITGMDITDNSDKHIFSFGNKNGSKVTLKLCYLNDMLNNKLGDCHYNWVKLGSISMVSNSILFSIK